MSNKEDVKQIVFLELKQLNAFCSGAILSIKDKQERVLIDEINKHVMRIVSYLGEFLKQDNKEPAASPELYEQSIKELDFTMRTYNCLIADNILTVGELVECTERRLRIIPNLGRKSLMEIKDALYTRGLKLLGVNNG